MPRRSQVPVASIGSVSGTRCFLRYPIPVRLKARGLPSVASPFSGMNVHRTFILFRFTPVPLLLHGPPINLLISFLKKQFLKKTHEGSPTDGYLLTGFRPRTTGSFLCLPKERNRKKRHPGLCAPHVNVTCGIPSLEACLSASEQGTSVCLARTHEIPLVPLRAWASAAPLTRLE